MKTTSLATRVAVALTIALLILLGIIAVGTYTYTQKVADQQLSTEVQNTAHRLAVGLEDPLWSLNETVVKNILISELQTKSINTIAIYEKRPDGWSFKKAIYKQGDQFPVLEDEKKLPNLPYHEAEVLHENLPIAKSVVYYTEKYKQEQLNKLLVGIIAFTLILLVALIALLHIVMHRMILHPLLSIRSRMKDIASGNGDLTKQIDNHYAGELYDLTFHINDFIKKLHALISDVAQNANQLAQTNTQVFEKATSMVEVGKNIQQHSETAKSIGQGFAHTISDISTETHSITQNILNINAAFEEMSSAIREVSSNCAKEHEISNQAKNEANGVMSIARDLNSITDTITKMLLGIQDIADKTNLLALNATIEAAGAGATGKGFAVVASEVKALSQQSELFTRDITKQVEAIRTKVTQTIDGMQKITDVISTINTVSASIASSVEEQSASLAEITNSFSHVAASSQSLDKNVQQVSNGAQNVSNTVQNIHLQSVTTCTEANYTCQQVDGMRAIAQALQKLVGQFKI